MRIKLTEKQIRQLGPFYDRVQATAAAGNPGMLVAQIRWDPPADSWWMEPGFLDHEHALCITEKGQHCPPTLLPIKPVGNTEPRSLRSAPGELTGIPQTVPLAHQ